jgi:hypothetical protein
MPWWKYVGDRVLTWLENRVLGLSLAEFHTGYRAFRREVLETVNVTANSDGFVFDQEIIAQAVAARFGIAEIRVPTRYFREASSASFTQSAEYGVRILVLLGRYLVHRTGNIRQRRFEILSARYSRLT